MIDMSIKNVILNQTLQILNDFGIRRLYLQSILLCNIILCKKEISFGWEEGEIGMSKLFVFLFLICRHIPYSRKVLGILYNCEIPRKTKIGKNVAFIHNARGVIINANSVIGNNVTIGHHVCIGTNCTSGAPIIHDNVFIGIYAVILGNVEIGEGAVIGACSLVMHDIPPNTIYYNKRTEYMVEKSTISHNTNIG